MRTPSSGRRIRPGKRSSSCARGGSFWRQLAGGFACATLQTTPTVAARTLRTCSVQSVYTAYMQCTHWVHAVHKLCTLRTCSVLSARYARILCQVYKVLAGGFAGRMLCIVPAARCEHPCSVPDYQVTLYCIEHAGRWVHRRVMSQYSDTVALWSVLASGCT